MAVAALLSSAGAAAPGMQENTAEARAIAKAFGGALKGELQAALQSGGPVNAVDVCHSRAPAIARSLSEQYGWTVGRTSLKPRNPENAPDAWELAVLQDFEARKRAGEDPQALEHAEVVEQGGARLFRYMKAIPTAAVCLNCHGGDTVKPEVEAQILRYYPDDQARGFREGDLRGAFTMSTPL
jgi:hypothetical protein